MKLEGDLRIAADRLYRTPEIIRLFAKDTGAESALGEEFLTWIAARLEASGPSINKAHDIRHLRECSFCRRLGDERHMPYIRGLFWHGICSVAAFGWKTLADVPAKELGKISIGEVGVTGAKKLCGILEAKG